MSEVRLLSKSYDLTVIDEMELADIMGELCSTYCMCRHEISTATSDVWDRIEHVSREIVRRSENNKVFRICECCNTRWEVDQKTNYEENKGIYRGCPECGSMDFETQNENEPDYAWDEVMNKADEIVEMLIKEHYSGQDIAHIGLRVQLSGCHANNVQSIERVVEILNEMLPDER